MGGSKDEYVLKDMPLLTISSPETIEKCAKLPLRPTDIFICSYPKSGTTWTQHIIISLLLLHRRLKLEKKQEQQNQQKSQNDTEIEYNHVSDYAPFYEIDPHWEQGEKKSNEMIASIREKHDQLGRRVFNTHLRCDMLPTTTKSTKIDSEPTLTNAETSQAKFIYLIRSPMDVCVSFYYHLSHQVEGCYEKSFDNFFQEWIDGDVPFGSWMDHVLSYAPDLVLGSNEENKKVENDKSDVDGKLEDKNKNVLLLSYEQMVNDLNNVIQTLVKYLELDDLIKQEEIEEIIETFSFKSMKNDLNRFQPKSVTWKNEFKFLRKGVVGDSKQLVSNKQEEDFKRMGNQCNFNKRVEKPANEQISNIIKKISGI